ncbi:MAG: hypothetical protein CNE89_08670 [Sphingomonadaceae bacterium MED-G03]|jgi:hypothetical protein|nr:MAG: hypothetical protein CNE89_08670 [Sphingomonadaceae bacterium MED-G03]
MREQDLNDDEPDREDHALIAQESDRADAIRAEGVDGRVESPHHEDEPAFIRAAPKTTQSAPGELTPVEEESPRALALPVIVNGRPVQVADRELSYEEMVRLAFPDLPVPYQPTSRGLSYTVTYRDGHPSRPAGALVPRQAVRLAPGTVISVAATTKG